MDAPTGRDDDPLIGVSPEVPGSDRDRAYNKTAAALGLDATGIRTPQTVGRYVVLETLGRGATSTVLSAYDPRLDRKLALKMLRPARRRGTDEWRHRLTREARALARLQHPGVVAVYDVGSHEGQLYLAMERVVGVTLRRWLAQERRPWRAITEVFVGAGRGLAAAHSAGVIHRDFKPDNVLIDEGGCARVVDFGLAGALPPVEAGQAAPVPAALAVTRTGAIVGTPAYLAPECFGESPGDELSDQFAYCVALYIALYGEAPFPGETVDKLRANVERGTVSIPRHRSGGSVDEPPAWLRAAVLRGLRTDPSERHASMAALLRALSRGRSRRSRRWKALTAAVGVGMVVVAVQATGRTPNCRAPPAAVENTWNEQRRDGVSRGFAGSGVPLAAEQAEHVIVAVDAWQAKWTRAWEQTCDASGVIEEPPRACLRQTLAGLDALVAVWLQPNATEVRAAVSAAHRLRDPGDCLVAARWRRGASVEAPADRAHELAALRERIERGNALADGGRYDAGVAELEAAAKEAEASDYLPVLAEALVAWGSQLRVNQESVRAQPVLERAFFVAQASGHDLSAVSAALELSRLVVQGHGSLERGQRWLRHATAIAQRWPDDPEMELRIDVVRGGVAGRAGRNHDKIAIYEDALARRIELSGPEDRRTGLLLHQLGATQLYVGQIEAAEQNIRRAVTIFESVLGPEHPTTVNALRALVAARLGSGDEEATLAMSRTVVERLERHFGRDHVDVSAAYNNHAIALTEAGRREEGLRYFVDAAAILDRQLQPGDIRLGSAHHNVGKALAGVGRFVEAREVHQRALELDRLAFVETDAELSKSHYETAVAHYDAGAIAAAASLFEESLALAEAAGVPPTRWVGTLEGLMLCRLEQGDTAGARRAWERAVELAGPDTPAGQALRSREVALHNAEAKSD